jgi:hypothetical protein
MESTEPKRPLITCISLASGNTRDGWMYYELALTLLRAGADLGAPVDTAGEVGAVVRWLKELPAKTRKLLDLMLGGLPAAVVNLVWSYCGNVGGGAVRAGRMRPSGPPHARC